MDGLTEQLHPIPPAEFWPWHLQRGRVSLGDVQDVQAVQIDGCGALQPAGLHAPPGAGLAAPPDSAVVNHLPQCAEMSSGPGLGGRPRH